MMSAEQVRYYWHLAGTAAPFLTFTSLGMDIKHPFTQLSLGGGFAAYATSYQLNVTSGCTDTGACIIILTLTTLIISLLLILVTTHV